MRSNFSEVEENYIKSVYHLQQSEALVTTTGLARHLNTSAASVTDMLKKLHSKRLIHYKPYKGFSLSKEGNRLALNIVRKHRLWEFFLVEKLNFSWDEVHDVAEQLEHISSPKLIEKLDAFLDHPQFDPHGDPIPDNMGRLNTRTEICLADLPLNKPAMVTSVINQTGELLQFLKDRKIVPGTRLEIKKKFGFDRSVEIKIKNKQALNLSEKLAMALNVKPL